ncbi:tetratricopeptide repeat protein [Halomontanus rarus]|uniref:tetratricopeptide repeat protein n=1 Tax=Halomontanus rarus TaxID=3034020 RepID=UPI00293BC148|nr:tetratricopeptide repeat protein [Halovivax sp. KZCA124]
MIRSTSVELPPPNSGNEFELLIADLFKEEYSFETFRHGRSGQSDDGVDIYFQTMAGDWIGIQCKNTGNLTSGTVREEVDKAESFTPSLDRYIIVTSASQDKTLQEKVRVLSDDRQSEGQFRVQLQMWDDIERLLQTHTEVFNDYYGDYIEGAATPLRERGIVELTPEYFEDQSPRQPRTAWQSELSLVEVNAGYQFERTSDDSNPFTLELSNKVLGGGHIVLHGRSGSGKSIILKQVACRAYERDFCVLYCSAGSDLGEAIEGIQDWLKENPTGLVVIEDGGRSGLEETCAVIETAEQYKSAGVLAAVRSDDWIPVDNSPIKTTFGSRPASVEVIQVPELSIADIEAAIDRYSRILGSNLQVSAEALARRLSDDPSGGSVLSLIHLLSLYGSDRSNDVSAPAFGTILDESIAAAYADIESEVEQLVAMQTMVLKISRLPLSTPFYHSLTVHGIDHQSIEEAINSLQGTVLFNGTENIYYSKHELWCIRYLEYALEENRKDAIIKFEQCLNAVFQLCDDVELRDSINSWNRKELIATEINEEENAAELAFHLFSLGQRHNSLVDYYGESRYSGIELPDTAPLWTELHQYIWRGVMAISRGGSSQGRGDLAWAREEYEQLLKESNTNETLSDAAKDDFKSLALTNLSLVKRNCGQLQEAKKDLQTALDLSPAEVVGPGNATVYSNLGQVCLHTGDQDEAECAFRKAIQIHRKYGDRLSWAKQLGGLAVIYFDRGETTKAQACNQTAKRVFEEFGDLQALTYIYGRVGDRLFEQGDYEMARQFIRQSLEINRQQGNQEETAKDLMTLGSNAIKHGQMERAQKYTNEARELFKRAGNKRAVAQCDGNLATIAIQDGDIDRAENEQRAVIKQLKELGDSVAEGRAYADLGNIYIQRGEFDQAIDELKTAGNKLSASGELRAGAKVIINAAQILYQLDREQQAGTLFGTGMLTLLSGQSYDSALLALDHLVEIHFSRDNPRQAIALAMQGWLIAQREELSEWESCFLLRYHFGVNWVCPNVYALVYEELYDWLLVYQPEPDSNTHIEVTAEGEHQTNMATE